MPKDPEDTLLSLEGTRTSFEDHRAQTEEEKRDLSAIKDGKNVDKASISYTFNTLNPLSWLH